MTDVKETYKKRKKKECIDLDSVERKKRLIGNSLITEEEEKKP